MHGSVLLTLFLQIGLIVALSRIAGWVFARFHQPQVMGEMIAGILLGPSLLGWLFPNVWNSIFPGGVSGDSVKYLNILSQVGVVFFLFLVGLELDPTLLRRHGKAAIGIGLASIIFPLALGMGLTVYLYRPQLFNIEASRLFPTALFMGAAMSVTAFPVLARILTERNLQKTELGTVAIACAAFNDVAAWCMLAFVVAVVRVDRGKGGWMGASWTAVGAAVYVLAMFFFVKPMLRRLEVIYDRQGKLSQNIVSIIFLLILTSAYATEAIGIHALFGAFIVGAIMPKGTHFIRHLTEKLEDYTVVFLLPIFFAFTGLRTQLQLLGNSDMLFDTVLIIFVACLGKFGGSVIAARAFGKNWREASALGILMNTRGLMELVILNVGRELAVISEKVFAMMVIMALVTTAMTTPLLNWVYPRRLLTAAREKNSTAKGFFSVLIPVSLPKSGGPLVQLADTIIGSGADGMGKLVALHLRSPADHPTFRSGLDEAAESFDESLAPLLAQARARSLPVESLSFISRDIAADINNVAKAQNINLVLMGFHKPILGRTILGGTVHRVLTGCETDVAIFVNRGFRQARKILVPYLGSQHDRLAMSLAARMARHTEAHVTVLHVVAPLRSEEGRSLDAKGNVDRVFQEPGQEAPVTFRVVEDPSPVGVVLHQAQQFDLVVIGVAEEWGLESHLFGWRAERIARDCPSSLLIVRKHAAGKSPPVTMRTQTQGETAQ